MATIEKKIGRVAQILNERELVISIGSDQGVKQGMKFAVLTEPLEIKDPETGELLDTVERVKIRVVVTECRKRVSVCRTYIERERYRGGGLKLALGAAGLFNEEPRLVKELESFHVTAEDLDPGPYAEEYIKVGDRVKIIDD